jgi:hypothetical protein
MYGEFATDPKVQMMNEADQRRFVMLLCLRCSNGHVTLHETEIAFQLRISNEEWATSKATFMAKGLIDDECQPCAWDRRQFVSDSSKSRVAAHRAKKKQTGNVTVTPPDTDTDTDTDTPPSPAYDGRTKFSMHANWQPEAKSFAAVMTMNGMANQVFHQDELLEFKSFWIATPDEHRTQAKWEHALAQHLKRDQRIQQASGRTTDGRQIASSRRPTRQGPLSAVDRVKGHIADRQAREAAAAAHGQAVGQDDRDVRPPLDGEFRRES